MKATSRFASLAIVIATLFFLPTAAHAQFNYSDNGDGTCTITGYTGPGGDITIPDTTNGLRITAIGVSAFQNNTSLISVAMGTNLAVIGNNAFLGCGFTTNVMIGANVATIGNAAFSNCANLQNVSFGTNVATIGSYAFSDTRLFSITLPANLASLGDGAFQNSSFLSEVFFQGNAPALGTSVFTNDATVLCYLPGTSGWRAPTFGGCPAFLLTTDYNFVDNGDGTYAITYYYGSGSIVNIPASTNGQPVTSIEEMAFEDCPDITCITVPNSITNIGVMAFEYCPGMTNITIGSGVIAIGASAFDQCTSLDTIAVDANNACFSSVNGVLFNKNQTLLIQFPEDKAGSYAIPGSVTTINASAFAECYSLTNVIIPNGVATIGDQAFAGCGGLTNIIIPASVTNIGIDAFDGCSSLTAITVDTNNVWWSSVSGVLLDKNQTTLILCPEDKTGSFTIPDSVIQIDAYAFSYCIGLTNIVIGTNVANIADYAFLDCNNLTSIIIPASVTNIGAQTFMACDGLTEICFLGAAPTLDGSSDFFISSNTRLYYLPGAAGWGAAFGGCPTAPQSFPNFSYTVTNSTIAITRYTGSGGDVTIPDTIYGVPVTSIGKDAFMWSDNLTGVTIPDSVITIGSLAFDDCETLTNVTIGSSATNIDWTDSFFYCTPTTVEISASNPAFCTVDGVVFDKAQTTLVYYYYAGTNESYVIPDNVTNIAGYAFGKGVHLTHVSIPSRVISIGYGAFQACYLDAITVDSNNVFYSSMDGVLFNKNQTTLIQHPKKEDFFHYTVPDSVTRIADGAFFWCDYLTDVIIGSSVTNIGNSAFTGCPLASVTIPNNVARIGDEAFACCYDLSQVYFQGQAPSLGDTNVFQFDTLTIYYLPGKTGWDSFAGPPPVLWNPQAVKDNNFGVRNNQFGFTITGPTDATIVVEACTNLIYPVWTPVSTNTLTGGAATFSDDQWTNHRAGCFYRCRAP